MSLIKALIRATEANEAVSDLEKAQAAGDAEAVAAAQQRLSKLKRLANIEETRIYCQMTAAHLVTCQCGDVLDQRTVHCIMMDGHLKWALCPACARKTVPLIQQVQKEHPETEGSVVIATWHQGEVSASGFQLPKEKAVSKPKGKGKAAFASPLRVLEEWTNGISRMQKKGQEIMRQRQACASAIHREHGVLIHPAFWLQIPEGCSFREPTVIAGDKHNPKYEKIWGSCRSMMQAQPAVQVYLSDKPIHQQDHWVYQLKYKDKDWMPRTFLDARFVETVRQFTWDGHPLTFWTTHNEEPYEGAILCVNSAGKLVAGIQTRLEQ